MKRLARVLALVPVLVLGVRHAETVLAVGHEAARRVPQPGASRPILGDCHLVPNYATSKLAGMPGSEPGLRRWATFPITYSVDASAMPAPLRTLYDDAAVAARDLWSTATGGRVAQLRQVSSGGQIRVRFVATEPGPAGFTTISGLGDVITGASIQMQRFPADVALTKRGLPQRVTLATVNTLAHEIGHALGIQLHSPDQSDLMHEYGNFVPGRDDGRDPGSFVTAADRNTLLHAYCR